MDIFKKIMPCLRHKILLYFQNPESILVFKEHFCSNTRRLKKHLLVSLNRYNYFRHKRLPIWNRLCEEGGPIVFDFERGDSQRILALRMDLFNILDSNFISIHNNPSINLQTYNSWETRAQIEEDYDVNIPLDMGHPPGSVLKWAKSCYAHGTLPYHKRRKVRAPRNSMGNWDIEKGTKISKNSHLKILNPIFPKIYES